MCSIILTTLTNDQPTGCSLNFCSPFPPRVYYYVKSAVTWAEAQQYCRMHHIDLATIETTTDVSVLKPSFAYSWAWMGLHDDPNSWKYNMGNDYNSWRWSVTGNTSKTGYQDWSSGYPKNAGGNSECVAMGNNGLWMDADCSLLKSVTCYNGKMCVSTNYLLNFRIQQKTGRVK